MKWNVDRKFNFGEIANFQDPRPPANIRPSELKRAGGAAKILPPQRAIRHAHVPVFVGACPAHRRSQLYFRPGGEYAD